MAVVEGETLNTQTQKATKWNEGLLWKEERERQREERVKRD